MNWLHPYSSQWKQIGYFLLVEETKLNELARKCKENAAEDILLEVLKLATLDEDVEFKAPNMIQQLQKPQG